MLVSNVKGVSIQFLFIVLGTAEGYTTYWITQSRSSYSGPLQSQVKVIELPWDTAVRFAGDGISGTTYRER